MDEFCLRWNNKKLSVITMVTHNAHQTIYRNIIQVLAWSFESCVGNIYWQNISFRPIERRDYWRCTLYAMTLCGLDIEDCLVTHILLWKFDIDFILFYWFYLTTYILLLFFINFIYFFIYLFFPYVYYL